MMNYKGFEVEYDEMFGWVVYDENGCPLSRSFNTIEDVKVTIDAFTK